MKKVDNEYILDTVYDLADGVGMKIDAFLDELVSHYGSVNTDLDGLPEEIAGELYEAREAKKERRKNDRRQREQEKEYEDIKRFKELFPDVKADDIPEEVWLSVEEGIPLPYAYALFEVTQLHLDNYAKGVNARNTESGAAVGGDGMTEPELTKERVERMSNSEVKSNYKNILKAMKSWKF